MTGRRFLRRAGFAPTSRPFMDGRDRRDGKRPGGGAGPMAAI
jgi:hypothetical protein